MIPRRYGVSVPFDGIALAEHRPWFEEIADLGYTDVSAGERGGIDAFAPLLMAAAWAPSLRLSTSIVPVNTRGPAVLAQNIASLCDAAPGRVAVGIGASSNIMVRDWNGMPFARPYQRVRDTLHFLREVLAGTKVTHKYDTFAVNGFRLEQVPAEVPPILVAALRPKMLRLAGEEGDGVVLGSISPDDLPQVLAEVGSPGEVVVRMFAVPCEDRVEFRAVANRIATATLTVPVYRRFHEWLGHGEMLEQMWALWDRGDRAGALAAVPDNLIEGTMLWGAPEQMREQMERFADAGATTTIPMIVTRDPGVRRNTLRALAP